MSAWIQEKIKLAKQEEGAEMTAREWLIYSDKVFEVRAPLLCKTLFVLIDRYLTEWNEAYPTNHLRRIEFQRIVPEGFLARKILFPVRTLRIWLDKADRALHSTLTVKIDDSTPSTETKIRLGIVLMDDGELHFRLSQQVLPDSDSAAELLLSSLLS